MAAGAQVLRLRVTPHSDRYDAEDDGWVEQETELFLDLGREAGGLERHATPAAGHKGVVETVLVALATAGAFNAAFECLTAWLTRDRTRSVEIAYTIDGREETFRMTGTHVDDAALDRLTEVAMARLESGP